MLKVVIKPDSHQGADKKWIPSGMIIYPSGGSQTEHLESYGDVGLKTKEEADCYFTIASNRKHRQI